MMLRAVTAQMNGATHLPDRLEAPDVDVVRGRLAQVAHAKLDATQPGDPGNDHVDEPVAESLSRAGPEPFQTRASARNDPASRPGQAFPFPHLLFKSGIVL